MGLVTRLTMLSAVDHSVLSQSNKPAIPEFEVDLEHFAKVSRHSVDDGYNGWSDRWKSTSFSGINLIGDVLFGIWDNTLPLMSKATRKANRGAHG